MTAPITGPFTKNESLWDILTYYNGTFQFPRYRLKRTWYRQAKPYTLPLQFDFVRADANSVYDSKGPFGNFYGSWIDSTAVTPDFPAMDGNLYNAAYAKFINKWKETVELGVATAEGRQAMSMVTQRLGQMANFTRHLATGRLSLAAGDLGIDWTGRKHKGLKSERRLPPKIRDAIDRRETNLPLREVTRNFSSLYLEFHFGWSPLMKDIYDACQVLSDPFKSFHVKAGKTGLLPDTDATNTSVNDGTWQRIITRKGGYSQTIKLQADLVITNPNLAMISQFGLANPLAIAWELVPFSFVLDWFVNVGDYLSSLTDFVGVELKNASTTTFTTYAGTYIRTEIPNSPSANNRVVATWNSQKVSCTRRLGLGGGPSIRFRAPKPWSIRRGLAAASLLMQRFPQSVIDENAISLSKKRTAFRANVFPSFNGKYW